MNVYDTRFSCLTFREKLSSGYSKKSQWPVPHNQQRRNKTVGEKLTTQILIHTLQRRIPVPDVLSAVAALAVGNVSRAGRPVPGTVRVSGKTTLGTGFPISLTAMELHLCHAHWRACIQGLLFEMMRREKEASYNEDNTAFKKQAVKVAQLD